MKKALVTGITGQDGSYLTELLLEKDYEVHGILRRSSMPSTGRIEHLIRRNRLHLHYGDLTDGAGLMSIACSVMPDEIYNLGAQSHVGVSFSNPVYTNDTVAMGALRMLECAREIQKEKFVKFYQASSSEMFGSSPPLQNEKTPFLPRSPYACAKVYAYEQLVNYREAYKLFSCNGILFNHECVTAETPVMIRRQGMIDIVPIQELVPHREDPRHKKYTTEPSRLIEVWDKDRWTKVMCMTATWSDARPVIKVFARGAVFSATPDHVIFLDGDRECEAGKAECGDRLTLCSLPESPSRTAMIREEAWLLGAIVADGYLSNDGHGRVTKNDENILSEVARLWPLVTGGYVARGETASGYTGDPVKTIELRGAAAYGRYMHPELYTETGFKRIPRRVLNASVEVQRAFLEGYNCCDGLKGGHCNYEFKSFTTNSPTLAAGLWWLASVTLHQRMIVCVEERDGATYFHINLNSPQTSGKGAHLRKTVEEIVGTARRPYTGWLFDLATESGTFHVGIGQGWIHNSPRRSENFVTRKITRAAARIKLGLQHELVLGNLDAKRDWGYAKDYVRAMWLMMQRERPEDYVIATGETHSVQEFLDLVFSRLELDPRKYVRTDPQFMRPTEVNVLCGDASRAALLLSWKPEVSFLQLVEMMVEHDLQLAKQEARLIP